MNETSNDKEKTNRPPSVIGMWIAIGAGMGVAWGVALGNIAVGICFGIGVGVAIGAMIDKKRKGTASGD